MEPVRTLAAYLLSAALTLSGVGTAAADPALGEGEAIPVVETAATATPAPEATLLPGGMTQSLRRGMEGEEVERLQQRLYDLGYLTDAVDGKFGINTLRAVKAFQRKHNLEDDGIAGKDTLTWLFSQAAIALPTATPAPTPTPSPTPDPTPVPTPTPSPSPVPELTELTLDLDAAVLLGEDGLSVTPARDAQGRWYLPVEDLAARAGWEVERTETGISFVVPGDPPRETAISYALDESAPVMVLVDGKLYVPSQEAQPIVDGGALYVPAFFLQEAFGLTLHVQDATPSQATPAQATPAQAAS